MITETGKLYGDIFVAAFTIAGGGHFHGASAMKETDETAAKIWKPAVKVLCKKPARKNIRTEACLICIISLSQLLNYMKGPQSYA